MLEVAGPGQMLSAVTPHMREEVPHGCILLASDDGTHQLVGITTGSDLCTRRRGRAERGGHGDVGDLEAHVDGCIRRFHNVVSVLLFD